jgi:hypothetical protein
MKSGDHVPRHFLLLYSNTTGYSKVIAWWLQEKKPDGRIKCHVCDWSTSKKYFYVACNEAVDCIFASIVAFIPEATKSSGTSIYVMHFPALDAMPASKTTLVLNLL